MTMIPTFTILWHGESATFGHISFKNPLHQKRCRSRRQVQGISILYRSVPVSSRAPAKPNESGVPSVLRDGQQKSPALPTPATARLANKYETLTEGSSLGRCKPISRIRDEVLVERNRSSRMRKKTVNPTPEAMARDMAKY